MKKNGILKVVKLLVIMAIIIVVVFAGIEAAKNLKEDSKEQNKVENTVLNKNENVTENVTENTNSNTQVGIKEKIVKTSSYYWQNPSEDYEEAILMGMQGASIYFKEDGTFSIDGGNGNWHEGSYEINGNTIICSIEKHNSAWHIEEEILEDTTEIKFIYNEQNDSLEVTNITKPTLTIHVIDMVTGELTEDTKEYSLDQFTTGNIYSSENKYEQEI